MFIKRRFSNYFNFTQINEFLLTNHTEKELDNMIYEVLNMVPDMAENRKIVPFKQILVDIFKLLDIPKEVFTPYFMNDIGIGSYARTIIGDSLEDIAPKLNEVFDGFFDKTKYKINFDNYNSSYKINNTDSLETRIKKLSSVLNYKSPSKSCLAGVCRIFRIFRKTKKINNKRNNTINNTKNINNNTVSQISKIMAYLSKIYEDIENDLKDKLLKFRDSQKEIVDKITPTEKKNETKNMLLNIIL